ERLADGAQQTSEVAPLPIIADVACLVLAPPDYARKVAQPSPEARERAMASGALGKAEREQEETVFWDTPQVVPSLVAVEREVAMEMGCAFWDTFSAMGGAGSIDRWAREEPPRGGPDRVHLTVEGYRWVAQQGFEALMEAYLTSASPRSSLDSRSDHGPDSIAPERLVEP
ncbi:MAG: hypothetical protein AAFX99_19690, partial [Myxococcota bacterium]